MINNIKNNPITEAATKKKINELNEIKKVETKGKRLIKSQEKLLRLFDDLKTIFNNNSNNNESNNKNEGKNEIKMWMKMWMKMRMRMKMWIKMKIKVKMKVKMKVMMYNTMK